MTQSEIKELREDYVSMVDRMDPPSIAELCRARGIDDDSEIRYLRRIVTRQNWEGHRQKRRTKLTTAIEKKEDEMIERVAADLVARRERYIYDAMKEVDDLLPPMLEELKARMDFLDDKALVTSIKMMMDARSKVLERIQHEIDKQDNKREKDTDRGLSLMKELGLYAKLADAVKKKMDHTDDQAVQNAVEQDRRETEALEILDAEVLNEG